MKDYVSGYALSYLRFFARKALKKHKPKTIGVAGSVGKSSATYAIDAVLGGKFSTEVIGNSETGIPLGILGMKPDGYSKGDWVNMLSRAPFATDYLKHIEYLIVEMGIDEPDPPKNMAYLLSILKPDIAVSLNVSATHSMQFDKTVSSSVHGEERLKEVVKNIAREDTKIITESHSKVAIYNADDENIVEEINKFLKKNPHTKFLTFGTKTKNNVSYGIYTVNLEGSYFQLYVNIKGEKQELKLKFKNFILPEVYREIFAASVLVGLESDMTLEEIKDALSKRFTLPKGRAGFFKGIRNSRIIDSSYNASRESVVEFLGLLDKLENETNRPTAFVFGDMRELGKEAQIEHAAVARRIIGTVDYLYLVGPQTMEFVLPLIQEQENKFKEIRWFKNSRYCGEHLEKNLPENVILLSKGSQNEIYLEEALEKILEDRSERKNLCRQSKYWDEVKTKYFSK